MKLLLCIFILFFNACKPTQQPSAHKTISVGMAHNLILQQENNTTFQIIDVRTPEEYRNGHIKNAINIDFMNDKSSLDSLNKNKTYLIYCYSGRRSALAANYLKEKDSHSCLIWLEESKTGKRHFPL